MRHTFLIVDLAGYSAMTEVHGDVAAADAAAAFYAEIRRLVQHSGGHEVKSMGDALLVHFDDAGAAVDLAVRLVAQVGSRHGALGVRAAVHTGTAVERDGDYFGAAVNVTARVADVAASGEVLVTDDALDAAGDHLGPVRVDRLGSRRFKNLSEPITMHRVAPVAAPPRAMTVDPVCRMAVDPERAPEHRSYRGTTYALCSRRCAEAFDRAPQRYAEAGAYGRGPWWARLQRRSRPRR